MSWRMAGSSRQEADGSRQEAVHGKRGSRCALNADGTSALPGKRGFALRAQCGQDVRAPRSGLRCLRFSFALSWRFVLMVWRVRWAVPAAIEFQAFSFE